MGCSTQLGIQVRNILKDLCSGYAQYSFPAFPVNLCQVVSCFALISPASGVNLSTPFPLSYAYSIPPPAVLCILLAVLYSQLLHIPLSAVLCILPAVLYSQLLHISCQLFNSASCSLLPAVTYTPASCSTVFYQLFFTPSYYIYPASCYILPAVLYSQLLDPAS